MPAAATNHAAEIVSKESKDDHSSSSNCSGKEKQEGREKYIDRKFVDLFGLFLFWLLGENFVFLSGLKK